MDGEINLTPTASPLAIERYGTGLRATHGNGDVLTARSWGTASGCTAGALLVHGLGAHSGWFEGLARRLKVGGIFVLAYDQLGFGKRRQQRFLSYREWLYDLASAFDYQKKLIGDKPLFVLANSMGAAVALKAVASKQIAPNGLAMFSPGIDGHPQTFNLVYRAKALFQAWTAPDTEIALPYTVDYITRDQLVREWISNDPDKRLTLPARMLWELLKMTRDMQSLASHVHCPVIMFSAGVDKLVNTDLNRRLFQRIASSNKSHRLFEEAWHDLLFDPTIDELVKELLLWMQQVSQGANQARC